MPTATYVDRTELGLADKLKKELFAGHQIICVTGPTKSGKSVLCRAVIGSEGSITIHGGQVADEGEFWKQAAEKLELSDCVSVSTSADGSVGLKVGPLSGDVSGKKNSTKSYSTNSKGYVLTYCRLNGITIIIDDFHYLGQTVQRKLVQAFKAEIFDGLNVVLIAVPHRVFDAVTVQKEMEGRFVNIEIPRWDNGNLLKIAELGFPALNARLESKVEKLLAKEAYGSPLLMQRFCLNICQEVDLLESEKTPVEITIPKQALQEIFKNVAEQFGAPTYKKLAEGPQARSDRIPRRLREGSSAVDIYEAILRAVALTGPSEEISYNDIRDKLRVLLRDEFVPQKHEVSNALRNMTLIAKEKISGEPVLEWMDDTLYITDPSLMFYMRWAASSL